MINQRIYFNQCLAYVLEATQKFENKLEDANQSAKEELFNQYIVHINKRLDSLTPDEKKLFWELSTLISLKNKISKIDEIFYGKLNKMPEGKMIGFLGPLGAGKTTTIQMLLGVLTPTSGEIKYFGKNFAENREEILEQVNFSSTYTNLPWNLTVRENLIYISYLYRIKNRKERLSRIIDIFRLSSLLNQQMEELSSGQVTRVNLAKAFINFPRVLLLDEPTASLDPESAKYIREFLLDQRKQFQVSIIFTSHNMAEVEEVCDRVIFIDKGKIIANDTPLNLSKTIEICHVELNVPDGLKRTIEMCEKEKMTYRLEGRYIVIDLNERMIPEFLKGLMNKGVVYDEISINKPTLEDYFISVTKHKPYEAK